MKGSRRQKDIAIDSYTTILFSSHARVRMFERNVSSDDVLEFLRTGEIIEQYSDDEPCPSMLLLAYKNEVPFHVVIAECKDHIRVITVYIPEPDKWIDERIRRIP
jgi:hypothetical protein